MVYQRQLPTRTLALARRADQPCPKQHIEVQLGLSQSASTVAPTRKCSSRASSLRTPILSHLGRPLVACYSALVRTRYSATFAVTTAKALIPTTMVTTPTSRPAAVVG